MFKRKNYLYMVAFYLATSCSCDEASKDTSPYGFTIRKDGKETFGSDKNKISILFLEDKNTKQSFTLSKDFNGKDTLYTIGFIPPINKSSIKYLIINDLNKRSDTLSLFYSVSKCYVSIESSLLNGNKGVSTTPLSGAVIFNVN